MITESVTTREIVGFLVPATLGCLAYLLATATACFISSVPRRVYIGRLVMLAVFVLSMWLVYLPLVAVAFSGDRVHYYQLGGETQGMGTFYGMHTIWIWCILALLKRPKIHHGQPA
jgi:hypothetical protein